ncbi:MAG: hypothetical protein ACPG71_05830, partial [Candidatus Puniceispirillaceae bacterium]
SASVRRRLATTPRRKEQASKTLEQEPVQATSQAQEGNLMLLANGRVKTDLMFAALFTLGFLSMSLYGLITLWIKLAFRRFEAQ